MMKRLLKNKAGVTILEGLIALGLLALVAGGTFGVLLSTSRKASQPDIREEMLLAVERASEQLQVYTNPSASNVPDNFKNGLCGSETSLSNVLSTTNEHDIECMLPAVCDRNNSEFSYKVTEVDVTPSGFPADTDYRANPGPLTTKQISFKITCNGFTL